MKHWTRWLQGIVLFALLLSSAVPALPIAAETPGPTPEVVEIPYASRAELERLSARLDVWEVRSAEGVLVAAITPAERAWLLAEGYTPRAHPTFNAHPDTIPGFPCYRTISEIYAQLDTWLTAYPQLLEGYTIGSSYQGRPLRVLRLTNEARSGPKPRFFLMANIHGRELITPEVALAFIQMLLDGYGRDPDITWVLDHHEIYVLTSSNPDGHVKNEPGQPWAYWRKNANPTNGCASSTYGVDLNRNHSFKWGGASTDPCDETYQGPRVASESETQAVQNFVRTLFPDQRGPGDNDAAPDTTTGVFITLHSYSNLVLWPWGHTAAPAPNSTQLAMLGTKLASYNAYTPQQSNALYPTTGTSDDWAYGELGIPAYTFEIGSSGDGFYPSCSRYDALVRPNLTALFYAAKVARTPYLTSFGPDALQVTVTPTTTLAGGPLTVTATLDDRQNGNRPIVAAEAYLDTPPWEGGAPYPLSAADGAFNTALEAARGTLPTAGLASGRHLLFVRGRDSTGFWGPVTAAFFWVEDDARLTGRVIAAETGLPLAGVVIAARGPAGTFTTRSGADGTYDLPLRSGTYQVEVLHFDYVRQVTTLTLTRGQPVTLDFVLTRRPWGTLTVRTLELGTRAPLTATVRIELAPYELTTTPTATVELPAGTYRLHVTAPGHLPREETIRLSAGSWITSLMRLAPFPPLLVVDDDAGADYETWILPAVRSLDYPFDFWSVAAQGSPTAETLSAYRGVLWFTGNDRYNSLTAAEQGALRLYLQGGGRLFLTGQNIGADIRNDPTNFYGTILHATFVSDTASIKQVAGSDFYAGLDFALTGAAGNQGSPDVIAPADEAARVVLTYPDGGAGLAVETAAYHLIYLGFGLEGVGNDEVRAELVRRGVRWLKVPRPPARLDAWLSGGFLPGNAAQPFLHVFNDSTLPAASVSVTVTLPASVSLTGIPTGARQLDERHLVWEGLTLASGEESALPLPLYIPAETGVLTLQVAGWWAELSEPLETTLTLTPAVLNRRIYLPLTLKP